MSQNSITPQHCAPGCSKYRQVGKYCRCEETPATRVSKYKLPIAAQIAPNPMHVY